MGVAGDGDGGHGRKTEAVVKGKCACMTRQGDVSDSWAPASCEDTLL